MSWSWLLLWTHGISYHSVVSIEAMLCKVRRPQSVQQVILILPITLANEKSARKYHVLLFPLLPLAGLPSPIIKIENGKNCPPLLFIPREDHHRSSLHMIFVRPSSPAISHHHLARLPPSRGPTTTTRLLPSWGSFSYGP